ncbi:MAG: SCO family protein [Campylobacterales bacterium]|nr:SCO family protein [Campylobacterales bacterium]
MPKISDKVIFVLFVLILLILVPLCMALWFTQTQEGVITIDKTVEAPWLEGVEAPVVLLYFGYVGCVSVCTPVLERLGVWYGASDAAALRSRADVVFVNLTSDVDPAQPQAFAEAFHPSFRGIYLSQKEIMQIDRAFALSFAAGLLDPLQINHSDYLYLLERPREGVTRLKTIYHTRPLNVSLLSEQIRSIEVGRR